MIYEIVHVRPDKREVIVNIEDDIQKVKRWLDTPMWKGTWLSDTKLLLRMGRGSIVIREKDPPPRVHKAQALRMKDAVWYELTIRNHQDLVMVWVNNEQIVGFNAADEVLWNTNSFTELSDIVCKELAFDVYQYYERLLAEYKLKGAI